MPEPFATLILTRPRDAAERFLEDLGDAVPAGLRVVISPLLEIVPTGTVADPEGKAGVIFTSANGVRFGPPGRGMRAWCVGPATCAAAAAAGWDARQMGGEADALVAALIAEGVAGPLLHVGGVHRRGDVAGRLTRAGIATTEVAVYDQRRLPPTPEAQAALAADAPVIVPLFSPRAARHFAEIVRPGAPLHIVAISDAVMAETHGLAAASRAVAASPDAQSMGDTVANLLRRVEAGHTPQ